ncbi:MAG: hypothetical protein ABIO49_09135 [Dokdonella sp.]
MILITRRREAALAEQRLLLARRGWHRETHAISASIARHSGWWIIGSGVASGAVAALIPLRGIGHAVRILGSVASFALRSPLGAMFAEAFAHKAPASAVTEQPDTSA